MDYRKELRQKLRDRRANLTLGDQIIASKIITQQAIQNPRFQQSQTIGIYIAINHEINPEIIINEIWKQNKLCYLPVVQKTQLNFCLYKKDTPLKKNYYHIPEPPFLSECAILPRDLDLVFVPLLGFTTQGKRLGMGGGFYDKTFSFLLDEVRPIKPYLIGLAYEWQKMKSFATSAWDVPLDAVISEKKTYYASSY